MVAAFEWFWDTPSWGWSYVWALAFLFVPFVGAWLARLITAKKPRLFVDG